MAPRATRSRAFATSEAALIAPRLARVAAWLAAAWAGMVATIGFVVAPVLFAVLARADAGRVASRLFEIEAYAGLALGAGLLVAVMRRASPPGRSRFSVEVGLALAALFSIVAGHFALQPMLDAARTGQGGPSFAVLHGAASAFYLLRFVVVAVLAWRLVGATGTVPLKAAAPIS